MSKTTEYDQAATLAFILGFMKANMKSPPPGGLYSALVPLMNDAGLRRGNGGEWTHDSVRRFFYTHGKAFRKTHTLGQDFSSPLAQKKARRRRKALDISNGILPGVTVTVDPAEPQRHPRVTNEQHERAKRMHQGYLDWVDGYCLETGLSQREYLRLVTQAVKDHG